MPSADPEAILPLDSVSRAILCTAALVGPTWRHVAADSLLSKPGGPTIYCFWHEHLLVGFHYLRRARPCALVSASRDGTRLSAVLQRWGYRVIRGSSSRKGLTSLRESMRALNAAEVLVMTPDGPRGPRREMKAGIARLAAATGATVLPVAISARPCIRLRSWDRFMVPLPFARVALRAAQPIAVPRGLLDEAAERALLDRIAEVLNG
jgi:lysophospholipid acyltransferase (LPLAT)-like uncharacterized protein